MKPIKSLIAVVLAGIFAMGCSSASETDSRSETAKTDASSTASKGSNSAETQTANQSGANAETGNPAVDFRERTNRRRRVDVDPSATPPPPNFRPAAEDSESAITMDQSGAVLEIRVFKKHPQIAKVEAIRLNETTKTLKVYLRDGKVVEVKTDRVDRLETISTGDILEIAGIPFQRPGTGRPRISGQ